VSVMYQKGRLKYASTRGDGLVGDDITQNVKTIRSVPRQLRGDAPDVFEVRGEAYLDKAGFEKLNRERKAAGLPLFANPRNAAAGSLKHLDPKTVAQRPLGIVFYGTGAVEGVDVGLHSKIFKLFKKLGLPTHEDWWVADSIDEILKAIRDLDQIRHDFPYQTDGAVIKVDGLAQRERFGNRYIRYSQDYTRALQKPWPELADEFQRLRNEYIETVGWRDLIDPFGWVFFVRHVHWQLEKPTTMFHQMYIADGKLRLATLVVQMLNSGVRDRDISTFLERADSQLKDPFTGNPMTLDLKRGRIYFPSADEKCWINYVRVPVLDPRSGRLPPKVTDPWIC